MTYIQHEDSCINTCDEYPCVNKIDINDPKYFGMICDRSNIIDYEEISKNCLPINYRIVSYGVERYDLRTNKDGATFYVWNTICDTPIWITSKLIDPSGINYVAISFVDVYGKINTIRKPYSSILTRKGILTLVDYGIILTDVTVKDIQEYFRNVLSTIDIPIKNLHSSFGWTTDNKGFVIGDRLITETEIVQSQISESINKNTIHAVNKKGSLGGWIKTVSPFLDYDNVRFQMYVACASPLLRILNTSSFVSEMVSKTSTGKTITTKIVMSLFGNPKELMIATDVTLTYIEYYCAVFNDLVIALDDTTLIDQKVIDRLVYTVANETGKGRGKKDGGIRDTNKWKSVCITSGELSVLSGRHMGGAEVRTIQVDGGIEHHIPEKIEQYEISYLENYGHIIELFIKKIFELQKEIPALYSRALSSYKKLLGSSEVGVTTRILSTYATVAVSGLILESVFNDIGIDAKSPLEIVLNKVQAKLNQTTGTIASRAYDVLLDFKISNRSFFNKDKIPYTKNQIKCFGNISSDQFLINEVTIEMVPTELEKMLDNHFDRPGIHKAILKEWKDEGILLLRKDGRYKKQLVIAEGEGPTDVYQIKLPGSDLV